VGAIWLGMSLSATVSMKRMLHIAQNDPDEVEHLVPGQDRVITIAPRRDAYGRAYRPWQGGA